MKYRYIPVLALFLLVIALFFSGCTAVRLADTHNVTVAVQSYNTWTGAQKKYDGQVHLSLAEISQNINAYNSELAKDGPDVSVLRENIAADRQALQEWEIQSSALDAATARFASETSALNMSASPGSQETIDVLTQDMKIYSVTMKNAEQHLVDYTNTMNTYLAPDDPDYWNDALRVSAMDANNKAVSTLADGDNALAAVTAAARKLEGYQ